MMQRIRAVLEKINVLAQRKSDRTVIDIDLMLDFTRMVYADLLDLRTALAAREQPANKEPTLDELTAARAQGEAAALSPSPPTPAPAPPPAPATPPAPTPAAHSAAQAKDIRHSIDLNEKYLLLSELFRNDVQAYEGAMKAINGLVTEEEALQWMNMRQWPANEHATSILRNLIKRFYGGQ